MHSNPDNRAAVLDCCECDCDTPARERDPATLRPGDVGVSARDLRTAGAGATGVASGAAVPPPSDSGSADLTASDRPGLAASLALQAAMLFLLARRGGNPRAKPGLVQDRTFKDFINGVAPSEPSSSISFSEDFSGDLSKYTVDVKTGDVPVINGGRLEQPLTVTATQNAIWRKSFDTQGRTVITCQATVVATQLSTHRSYPLFWFSEDPNGDVDNAYMMRVSVGTGAQPRALYRVTDGVLGSALAGSGDAIATSGWNGSAYASCTLTVVVTIGASSVTVSATISGATFGGTNGTYTWVDSDVARYSNIRSVGIGFWVTGVTYAPSFDDVVVSAA